MTWGEVHDVIGVGEGLGAVRGAESPQNGVIRILVPLILFKNADHEQAFHLEKQHSHFRNYLTSVTNSRLTLQKNRNTNIFLSLLNHSF